jgi:hypothetical protein
VHIDVGGRLKGVQQMNENLGNKNGDGERRSEAVEPDGREARQMWALIGESRNVCTLVGQKHWRLDR